MVDSMEAVARRQHGLITLAQARMNGLSEAAVRNLLRSGRWRRVRRGVFRLEGAPATPRSELLAGILASPTTLRACRTTAAALHGLPGFDERPFHVVAPIEAAGSAPALCVHRTKRFVDHEFCVVDAIPTTAVARTLFDLCGCVSFARAERAIDTALVRRLVRADELVAVFEHTHRRGRLGSAGLRAFLEARGHLLGADLESELERRFIALVERSGLPLPDLQVDLGIADGWVGRVDAYFRSSRLIVELDGAEHHRSLVDRRRDAARDAMLEMEGFRVVRLTWNDVVGHPGEVIRRLQWQLRSSA